MKLFVTIKCTAKRKGYLSKKEFTVSDKVQTLSDLLCDLCRQMVTAYQKKEIDTDVVSVLTEEEIEDSSKSGKIGFGRKYGSGKVNIKKAEETMLTAFKDGLFRVFLNDNEVTDLSSSLELSDKNDLILVRMIMLAGSLFPYLL